ncbi:MAG TPA: hypothetical protein VF550_01695, partial [Polyangia bacterium]
TAPQTFDQTAKTVAVSSTGDVYFGGSYKGGLGALGLTSTCTETVDNSTDAGPITKINCANLDAFVAQLAGADGSVVCARTYGDATGAQMISSVSVARATTGALADSVTFGGSFASRLVLGPFTLDTGSGSVSDGYVARVAVSQ